MEITQKTVNCITYTEDERADLETELDKVYEILSDHGHSLEESCPVLMDLYNRI